MHEDGCTTHATDMFFKTTTTRIKFRTAKLTLATVVLAVSMALTPLPSASNEPPSSHAIAERAGDVIQSITDRTGKSPTNKRGTKTVRRHTRGTPSSAIYSRVKKKHFCVTVTDSGDTWKYDSVTRAVHSGPDPSPGACATATHVRAEKKKARDGALLVAYELARLDELPWILPPRFDTLLGKEADIRFYSARIVVRRTEARFCVVMAESGAWAVYDTAKAKVTRARGSGRRCTGAAPKVRARRH